VQPDSPVGFPFLMSDIVSSNRRWVGNQTALIFKNRQRTWIEFSDDVALLQRGLSALGVVRGSRVAALDRNSDDYILLHYALAGMGAILVPINIMLRASEVAYILGNCQPRLLMTSDEFDTLAAEAMADLLEPPKIIKRGIASDGQVAWDDLYRRQSSASISRPVSATDPHLILYTSGTTGRPKGAIISHQRSILDALSAIGAFGIRTKERFFCYMPLFHTGAWDYIKLYFMQQGSVVVTERFEAETAVRAIHDHRCTGMFGVPVVLRKMVESEAWGRSDLSSMRLIAYASYDPSNLIVEVAEAFRKRGATQLNIANAYGLTEGGPYITILRPEESRGRPHSIGTPVPGAQVALLDEEGNEVPQGEMGEICIRSSGLMTGYLNRPEATEDALRGDWLHTGDVGRMDEEGYLYLVDRMKDMIRTGGENVFAKEVEQVLVTHDAVSECAVIGMPDNDYGERVVAVVVREPGAALEEADLIAFTRSHIATFKSPRQVVFVDDLPKTPAGKIQKHVLRKALASA